jgi:arginine deiminase
MTTSEQRSLVNNDQSESHFYQAPLSNGHFFRSQGCYLYTGLTILQSRKTLRQQKDCEFKVTSNHQKSVLTISRSLGSKHVTKKICKAPVNLIWLKGQQSCKWKFVFYGWLPSKI